MNPTNQASQPVTGTKYIHVLGILSIVFGSLGLIAGLIFLAGAVLAPSTEYPESTFVAVAAVIIFWIIPHIYFLISGIKLVKFPAPSVVKGFAITSIVLGALWNIVILAFAIVVLTQLREYEEGFGHSENNLPPQV